MVEVIIFIFMAKSVQEYLSQFRPLRQRRTTDCSRMHDLHWAASLQTVSSSCRRQNMLLHWNPTSQHPKNRVSLIIFHCPPKTPHVLFSHVHIKMHIHCISLQNIIYETQKSCLNANRSDIIAYDTYDS